MKLSRLAVRELRQFSTRFELIDLEAGLNLISGANETGKSALVRALQAAFFERFGTKSVDDLRPWQDPSAAPEVEVDFEYAGRRYQLAKRFLKKSQCRLQCGADHYEGEQAEALLQELLGFSYPGKGASREEYWGIPGLLWITQGTGQDLARPIGHAHDFLRESLSQGIEEMATSGGDALIDEIAADRAQLLTQTGKPTGELKKLIAEAEDAKQALAETGQRMVQYQQLVDRLGTVRAEWQLQDRDKPWAEAERRKTVAQRQLDLVNAQRQTLARAEAELKQARNEQQLLFEQLRQWQQEQAQLDARAARVTVLQQQMETSRQRRRELESQLAEAEQRLKTAEQAFNLAESGRRRSELEAGIRDLQQSIESDRVRLGRAREAQEKRILLQQELARTAIDGAQVERLAEQEDSLRRIEGRRSAVATRVRYRLVAGQELTLGSETLTGEGEATLIEPARLQLNGIGELTIEPGGQDLTSLAAQEREARHRYQAMLAELKLESLAQARSRLSEQRDAEQQLRWQDQTLRDLAPAGIEALAAELSLRETRLGQLRDSLDTTAPLPDGSPTLEAARDALALAQQQHKGLAAQLQAAREQEIAAVTELGGAQAEHEELQARIKSPDRQERHDANQNRLLELGAVVEHSERDIARQQAAIETANPQLLEDDIQRFGRAAEVSRAAQRERVTEIARLEGALGAEGAASLGEERAERQARAERVERHLQALEQRAAALDLLYRRLQDKRTALVERLQAPLQKHIAAYLRILFPEAQLQINEAFQPGRLAREGSADVDFSALSFGAREQIGVILRLAYADALQAAGRPTLIVLDDALVHSDRPRREAMQRVLYSAARRHQILLFTCHPDNWAELGVPVRALEKLKAEAGL